MVSKPTIGQTGWAVPLNAALDDLEARKLDITVATGGDDGGGQAGKNFTVNPAVNSIASGQRAAVIAGGGITGSPNRISGSTGNYNVIGGGYDNDMTTTGIGANTMAGGAHHRITGTATHATVAGGSYVTITAGDYGTAGGGTQHVISATGATIGGGQNSAASGVNATIAGGSTNTASGTSAVVCGGATNTASGNSSVVGGGTTNLAHGGSSVLAGGNTNTLGTSATTNGDFSVIGGGFTNSLGTASSARYSVISGGRQNTVPGVEYATVPGGRENTVTLTYGQAGGYGAKANRYGQSSQASGFFSTVGDAQTSRVTARATTAGAVSAALFLDGAAGANRITVTAKTVMAFSALVAAKTTTASKGCAYRITGAIMKDTTAGSTRLIGIPTVTVLGEDDPGCDIAVTADATNGALVFTATGVAGETYNWFAGVELSEVASV